MVEPKASRRQLRVTQRRTKVDFARCLQELVDELYPQAEQIEVILDNLNTHTPQALYETLARRRRSVCWRSWNSITRLCMAAG
jgi:ATP/maltotriose-dependent transcriptional regulator MalT